MAVNPKIIMMVAQAAKSHKVREVVLHVVFYSLGIILFIFTAFIALISGLLAIVQNTNLRNHWNYYRTSISELFNGIESDINTNVKDEVYDFMPEFSVNLSKATIANNFDGSSLILYDDDEISRAEDIMLNYAGQLRAIKTQDEFDSFISDFDTDLSFSDISSIRFTDDTGIDNLSEYSEELKVFLYHRAMEQMSKYTYTFENVELDDGKRADRQTLVVTAADGSTQTVEYTCIGGGEVIDKMTRDKNKIRKKNRQCSKAHFGRVKNKKCSKAMSGDYTEILQNIGRITDNCVGIAEEAMDNVKFMTLNAEEMEQYGNVIDFSQAKQVEGTEA